MDSPILKTDPKVQEYLKKEKAYDVIFKKQLYDHHHLLIEKQLEKQQLLRHYAQPYQPKEPKKPRIEFLEKDLKLASLKNMKLVPIRLDIEQEGVRLRDTFTWNLYDDLISPDLFAKIICEDNHIGANLIPVVAKQIKEQLDDYFQHAPEAMESLESWNRGSDSNDSVIEKDLPELRTIIKLDITIDQQSVIDQFEWDIACRRNSPELFAEQMVLELKLHPEFKTAIAHCIREQVFTVVKSLLIVNHNFMSNVIYDEQLARLFLPPVQEGSTRRGAKEINEFGPSLVQTSAAELEKMEKDLERELRRKRRQSQRSKRVVALPETNNTKTHRTSIPNAIKFIPVPKEEPTENGGLLDPKFWECLNCGISGFNTPLVRSGPDGPKTLCNDCGLFFQMYKALPDK